MDLLLLKAEIEAPECAVFTVRQLFFMGVKKKYLTCGRCCYMMGQVRKMNDIFKQVMLYDFYGELLTKHQKEIYEQAILEDLSLGEIAKEAGISRQGVQDLVRRCDRTLQGYEEKLHLLEKFLTIKEKIHCMNEILDSASTQDVDGLRAQLRSISDDILKEL